MTNENNTMKDKVVAHVTSNKEMWIGIVVVVAVIALLAGLSMNKKKDVTDESLETATVIAGCENGNLFSTVTGEPCPTTGSETEVKATTKYLGYAEALKKYEGKTITLRDACAVENATVTYPQNSLVMIANDGKESQTVKLDTKVTTLRPYHYDVAYLQKAGEFKLVCNDKEVVTVTVQ